MSTINNTDTFLIARGANNFKVTAGDVAAFSISSGLPSQAGNAGKFLTTDGTTLSWAAGGGGGGVTSIIVTGPITDTGSATVPNIGILAATAGALGAVQIGTNVQVTAGGTISILDASDTQKGVIETATLAEAATGTSTLLALTASTGVPKTSADMAGAAIIPSGTAATTPAAGAGRLRYYTDTRGWFANDGTSWIPFDQRKPAVVSAAYSAKANDYVVVDTAGQTVTLPAAPPDGTCVTVVVDGTFLDTIVARGVNTDNIMGLAQDITLDKQYAAMQFTYVSSTSDWRLN